MEKEKKKREEESLNEESSFGAEEASGPTDEEYEDGFDEILDSIFEPISDEPTAVIEEEEEAEEEEEEEEEVGYEDRFAKRHEDRRIDRVVSQLIKALTGKKPPTKENLNSIFRLTISKIVTAVNAQAITIYFLEDDGKIHFGHVYYSKSLYKDKAELEQRLRGNIKVLKEITLEKNQGIVGRVIGTNKSVTSLVAKHDPDFYKGLEEKTGFEIKSMLTVPISADNEVYGAIQVMNKNPMSGEEFFSYRDLKLLEEVADYSAKILYKARHPDHKFSEQEMSQYIARLAKCEYFDLTGYEPDQKLLALVGEEPLRKFYLLPIQKTGSKSLKVAMANPLDFGRKHAFEMATELIISTAVVSPEGQIRKIINEHFRKEDIALIGEELGKEYADVEKVDISEESDKDDAPIIQLANRIIEDAYSRGASDIHIEPFETETIVRYRVDGVLETKLRLPPKIIRPLCARLKIMSGLDISERRLPQDGRIAFKEFTRTDIDVDLRVASAPMAYGEKIVMRLLDKTSTALGLEVMGFFPEQLEEYRRSIREPYGMILHVGPTGSGKTTTLYSALSEINKPNINIQTAEDPIEYNLMGINQLQVRKDIGLTFSAALRSYLRQDPDVILVGEIRDFETASIAIEAALTGHLLFSTLHTNDAAGTVVRFIEMGIEPFLVASSLLVVCAQRLMRRLCKCKVPHEATPEERETIGIAEGEEVTVCAPGGCPRCANTGYKGRIGVYELLFMNQEIRDLTNKRVSSDLIRDAAIENGMVSLFRDAMRKVKNGTTSLEEALRVVRVEQA
jgi:type IV pilus assembly protein PilB